MQYHQLGLKHTAGRDWRLFPAMTTTGFYDSFAQYIELSAVSSVELRTALDGTDPRICVKVLPLLFHEQQHWFDHLSTLAGRRRLVRAIEAMEARVADDPTQFWRIIDCLRTAEADYFDTYYQTINSLAPTDGRTRPWAWELTAGMRFDPHGRLAEERPIFFTRFSWPDGSTACRVPFSVSALLEARAMSAEMAVHLETASKLPEGERIFEMKMASNLQLDRLYDPRLAVYNAAAHLIGNVIGIDDAIRAFKLASHLAHICLDLPSQLFNMLKVPNHFAAWKERVPGAVAAGDRGFAFLVLAHHGADIPTEEPAQWLEETVRRGGLPCLAEIKTKSSAACAELRSSAAAGRFTTRLEHLWVQGDAIRDSYGYTDSFASVGSSVSLPPVYCNDLSWVLHGQLAKTTSPDEVERWWNSCNLLARKFQEFRHACGT
ncbi:MAG TPA: hypothetical protein VK157_13970 [Phycisphaerales bacterium]|nr:hypothetical protein [Phycisphaerales bacterium]